MERRIEIFLLYAQEDTWWASRLEVHLGVLQRQRFFHAWYSGKLGERDWRIEEHFVQASIILLFISPSFMKAEAFDDPHIIDYIMRRQRSGDARVIPILLRPVSTGRSPIVQLQLLPTNLKPIINWRNRDNALFVVAEGIREAAEELEQEFQLS